MTVVSRSDAVRLLQSIQTRHAYTIPGTGLGGVDVAICLGCNDEWPCADHIDATKALEALTELFDEILDHAKAILDYDSRSLNCVDAAAILALLKGDQYTGDTP